MKKILSILAIFLLTLSAANALEGGDNSSISGLDYSETSNDNSTTIQADYVTEDTSGEATPDDINSTYNNDSSESTTDTPDTNIEANSSTGYDESNTSAENNENGESSISNGDYTDENYNEENEEEYKSEENYDDRLEKNWEEKMNSDFEKMDDDMDNWEKRFETDMNIWEIKLNKDLNLIGEDVLKLEDIVQKDIELQTNKFQKEKEELIEKIDSKIITRINGKIGDVFIKLDKIDNQKSFEILEKVTDKIEKMKGNKKFQKEDFKNLLNYINGELKIKQTKKALKILETKTLDKQISIKEFNEIKKILEKIN